MIQKYLVLILLILTVNCTSITKIPPELKPLYTANEVLFRIKELQTVTIDSYESKRISKEKAKLIVEFTIIAADTIEQSIKKGQLWRPIIKELWQSLKKQIPFMNTDSSVTTIWNLVNSMVETI